MKAEPSTIAQGFRPGRHFQLLDPTVHDPYQIRGKLQEPSVCPDCGAVYHLGRWQWLEPPIAAAHPRCPACQRIHDELPAGYLTLEGEYVSAHQAELLNLVRNLETHAKAEHPLKRIMAIEESAGQITITTTDIHLPREIGEALHAAYKGTLDFHYNPAEYLLRVSWRR